MAADASSARSAVQETPNSSALLHIAKHDRENAAERARSCSEFGRRAAKRARPAREAALARKNGTNTLIFFLCCSNRNGVPCDSHRHFFEVAIYHGQEDGMAKKATKAKTKPAAKKTPAKKSTAATKRKTTTRKK
jgi:hypothetical protein